MLYGAMIRDNEDFLCPEHLEVSYIAQRYVIINSNDRGGFSSMKKFRRFY